MLEYASYCSDLHTQKNQHLLNKLHTDNFDILKALLVVE